MKGPPNYGSRSMQWRLLVCVAVAMLLLAAVMDRNNPRFAWLWKGRIAPEAGVDARLRPTREMASDEVVVEPTKPKPAASVADKSLPAEVRAWRSGWNHTWQDLSLYERQSLYQALYQARRTSQNGIAPSAEQLDLTEQVIQKLDQSWASYLARARESLKDLDDEEQAAWTEVVEQTEKRWNSNIKPALGRIAEQTSQIPEEGNSLDDLQQLLDDLQLNAVEDNTVWRASEREIWFRLIEKLQTRSLEELQQQSTGEPGYAALFKQSAEYRGRLVTVRGRAEAVYQVAAPPNSYGVEHYWIYWIAPEGGPASPMVIYALEKPSDFPSIEFSKLGKTQLTSQEDVEFTGYFFKRYAYQGQGGIFAAPLLLARGPKWLRTAATANDELPSAATFALLCGGLALLAAGLATLVYYQHRPGRRQVPESITLPQTAEDAKL